MFHRRSTVEALRRKVHHLERQVHHLRKADHHHKAVARDAIAERNAVLESQRDLADRFSQVVADNQRLRHLVGESPDRAIDVHEKRWRGYDLH